MNNSDNNNNKNNNNNNNNTHAHTLTKKELTRAGKLDKPLPMPTPPTKHSVDEENDEQQRANVPQGGKRQR
jgi:hypothetical protein